MRFGSRLLREDQDQGDDHHQQRQRGSVTAESQASFREWLIEKIADDSSERAGQDEGGPKQNDARNAREIEEESGQKEQTSEDPGRPDIAHFARNAEMR